MNISIFNLFSFDETVNKRQSTIDDTEIHQLSLYYNKVESAAIKKAAKLLMPKYFENKIR